MSRLQEQIKKIRATVSDPKMQRDCIAELNRKGAVKAMGNMVPIKKESSKGGTWDVLLKTSAGAELVQAKEAKANTAKHAESRRIAGRIRQIKELAFEVIVRKGHDKPVYEQYKGKLRKIGELGGDKFEEAIKVLQASAVSAIDDYFHYEA